MPATIIAGITTLDGSVGQDKERDPGREDRPEVELPFRPDVPELHPEGDGNAQPGQQQRDCLDERLRTPVREPNAPSSIAL